MSFAQDIVDALRAPRSHGTVLIHDPCEIGSPTLQGILDHAHTEGMSIRRFNLSLVTLYAHTGQATPDWPNGYHKVLGNLPSEYEFGKSLVVLFGCLDGMPPFMIDAICQRLRNDGHLVLLYTKMPGCVDPVASDIYVNRHNLKMRVEQA